MIEKIFCTLTAPPRVLKANFKDFSPGEEVYRHWSRSHVCILVIRGRIIMRAGPRFCIMNTGDIFSIPYAVPRQYTADKQKPAGIITLHLAYHPWDMHLNRPGNWDFQKNGGDFTRETMEPSPFVQPFRGICSIHPSDPEELFKLARDMVGLFNEPDSAYNQALSRALAIVFIDRFRLQLQKETVRADSLPEPVFHELLHWIEHNYTKKVTTAQLVHRARLSYTALHRLFKRMTGKAPMDYIIDVRLNQAKQLLIASGSSIKEIAYNVGIQNQQYFSRLFKNRYGIAPQRFREKSAAARITLP